MTDLKASPCGEMSDQGQGPSQKLLRDLLERRGLIEDSSIRNEKARVAEKELRRNMYHNTQVMLKNYRDIVWALECFPGETAQELEAAFEGCGCASQCGRRSDCYGKCKTGAPPAQHP